jgi:hypothetical protein
MTNLPVPTPFNHFDSWQALPQHGFGVRFAASVAPGGWGVPEWGTTGAQCDRRDLQPTFLRYIGDGTSIGR